GLRPVALADLGNRAVIEHDLNVYRVLFALGGAPPPCPSQLSPGQLSPGQRDFSLLEVPEIDPEPGSRRLLSLDIQTALCLMNIPFALCLTPGEYRRGVHSLRLGASLLGVVAAPPRDGTV